MMIVPQICLFEIPDLLQKRGTNDFSPTKIWLSVFLLGISKVAHIMLESR